MSKFTRDQILERIKGLLALADVSANTFTEEASLAMRKAEAIMQRYNIELAEVLRSNPASLKDIVHRYVNIDEKMNKYTIRGWRISLFYALAEVNLCRAYFNTYHLIVVGRPLHVEVVEQMYYSLSNQIEELAIREARAATQRGEIKSNWPSPHNTRTWKTSFMIGACKSLCTRIRLDHEASLYAQGQSVSALVVVSRQQIDDYAKVTLRPVAQETHYGPAHFNVDAYVSGNLAGQGLSGYKGIEDKT